MISRHDDRKLILEVVDGCEDARGMLEAIEVKVEVGVSKHRGCYD